MQNVGNPCFCLNPKISRIKGNIVFTSVIDGYICSSKMGDFLLLDDEIEKIFKSTIKTANMYTK